MKRLACAATTFLVITANMGFAEGTGHSHGHDEQAAVPHGAAAPTIAIDAHADSVSGYNVHITTTNFVFRPDTVGHPSEAVEGHAHIYVNDVKVQRVYGDWVHLPAEVFVTGKNVVEVTLNDNMHREWAAHGTPVAASLELDIAEGGAAHGAHGEHKNH